MTPIRTAEQRFRVLNVGGGDKKIPIPAHYDGWEHLLLDIDARGARTSSAMRAGSTRLPPAQFDAVYCSHNLEHYYRHDTAKVLRGFLHVLKQDGFAEIRVPDLRAVMRRVVRDNLDMATSSTNRRRGRSACRT